VGGALAEPPLPGAAGAGDLATPSSPGVAELEAALDQFLDWVSGLSAGELTSLTSVYPWLLALAALAAADQVRRRGRRRRSGMPPSPWQVELHGLPV
jgi:hypothetical protein